mgnify:CR=1 FL=1
MLGLCINIDHITSIMGCEYDADTKRHDFRIYLTGSHYPIKVYSNDVVKLYEEYNRLIDACGGIIGE